MLLSYGPFFFALNQPATDGADEINIPRCRGGYLYIPPANVGGIVKIAFLRGVSFFVLIYPWPDGADEINIPRCRRG